MARYRKIDTRVWNDEKFRGLSDKGKLAFFFVLTHPHMTAIGAMRASIPGLACELGWSEKAFREAFQEALSKGMAAHDEKACLVWLPNFLKYNKPESPNVVKSWDSALDLLPECDLKNKVIQYVKAFLEALPKAFREALPEAFREAFRKGMPNQEQEQEQDITPPVSPPTPLPGSLPGTLPDASGKSPPRTRAPSGIAFHARETLNFLNQVTGSAYQPVNANLDLITHRLKEAANTYGNLEQAALLARRVCIDRVKRWRDDDKMRDYLRPATLFAKRNFWQYAGQLPENLRVETRRVAAHG